MNLIAMWFSNHNWGIDFKKWPSIVGLLSCQNEFHEPNIKLNEVLGEIAVNYKGITECLKSEKKR